MGQGCSCDDCALHFAAHTGFHRTFKFGCKWCFQLEKIFPHFNFFSLEARKNPLESGIRGPSPKPNVVHVDPETKKEDFFKKIKNRSWKKDPRPVVTCPECNVHGSDAFRARTASQMKEHIKLNHLSTSKVFNHCYLKPDTAEVPGLSKCFQCASVNSTPRELNRHIESVHYEEYFSCSECLQSFSRKDSLTRHKQFIHGKGKFSCELCGKEFQRKDILIRHQKSHKSEGSKIQCMLCGSSFLHKFHLLRHMQGVYTDSGTANFHCEECDKTFCTRRMMEHHCASKHCVEFSCELCGKRFTQNKSLTRHINTRSPSSCLACRKCFCYAETMKAHIEDAHSIIECGECELKLDKDNLKLHKYWAHGQKLRNVTKLSCASDQDETITPKHVSDTKEVNDGEAKFNADSQAGDQFVCTDCGKVFKRKFNLRRHRKEMHDCTNCDEKFCTSRLLQKHYNVKHLTIACKECRETFARKSTLEEHIRNRQKVSCDECSQTFCYQSRLLDHRKKMHASIACEECGQMINKKYLDVHKSWSHK